MRQSRRLAAALFVLAASALAPAGIAAEALEAPPTPVFVTGEWLQANLGAKNVFLVDARPLKDFLAAHLRGAVSVTPENLRSTWGGVPAATYPDDLLGAIFARAGVSRGSLVVVYGAESDIDATYVALAARIAGVERVTVLDGGFARWTTEGRPTTKDRVLGAPANPGMRADTSVLVPIEEVRKRVGDGRTVFLDVRSEELWAAGHIPGAKNRFWKKDVDGGSFRPAEQIRAGMEAAGVSWEKPVVVYCNSGHQASEGFYVLKYVLGHPDVKLYQGSWLEWSMHPDAPRELPAPPEPK